MIAVEMTQWELLRLSTTTSEANRQSVHVEGGEGGGGISDSHACSSAWLYDPERMYHWLCAIFMNFHPSR